MKGLGWVEVKGQIGVTRKGLGMESRWEVFTYWGTLVLGKESNTWGGFRARKGQRSG